MLNETLAQAKMTRSSDESDERDRHRPSPPRRSSGDGERPASPTGEPPAEGARSAQDRRSTAPRRGRAGANHWGEAKRRQKQVQCDTCGRWIVDLAASKYQHENSKYCRTWWHYSRGKAWREAEHLATLDVAEFQKGASSAKTATDKQDWQIRQQRIADYMNRRTPSRSHTRDRGRTATRTGRSRTPRPRAGDSRSRTRERAADKRRTLRRDSRDSRRSDYKAKARKSTPSEEGKSEKRDKENTMSRKPTSQRESSKDTRKVAKTKPQTTAQTSKPKASSKGHSGAQQAQPGSDYEYYSDSEEQSKEPQSSTPAPVANPKVASEAAVQPGLALGYNGQLVNQLLKTAIREGLKH